MTAAPLTTKSTSVMLSFGFLEEGLSSSCEAKRNRWCHSSIVHESLNHWVNKVSLSFCDWITEAMKAVEGDFNTNNSPGIGCQCFNAPLWLVEQ